MLLNDPLAPTSTGVPEVWHSTEPSEEDITACQGKAEHPLCLEKPCRRRTNNSSKHIALTQSFFSLQAECKIAGRTINAAVIQGLVLGCSTHCPGHVRMASTSLIWSRKQRTV
jgi:hypothetical protein